MSTWLSCSFLCCQWLCSCWQFVLVLWKERKRKLFLFCFIICYCFMQYFQKCYIYECTSHSVKPPRLIQKPRSCWKYSCVFLFHFSEKFFFLPLWDYVSQDQIFSGWLLHIGDGRTPQLRPQVWSYTVYIYFSFLSFCLININQSI